MSQGGSRLGAAWLFATWLTSCGASPSPAPSAPAPPAPEHHHELHLPPVGPTVRVTVDGKSTDVALGALPHEGTSARLADLVRAAAPGLAGTDLTAYHFDLTGSDGFHPASRPPCARPLGAAEVAAAHIDVVTHDVSYDPPLTLPGCYRVKAVVTLDASR